jgi:hypothetical protein
MSTSAPSQPTTPPPAPPPAVAAPPPERASGQVAGVVGGSILAVIGALIAIAGGALVGIFGSNGTLSSGRVPLATSSAALVSSSGTIDDSAGAARVLGDTTVKVAANAGTFVGIGPTAEVERYLAGAPVDEVTDMRVDPFRLTRQRRTGLNGQVVRRNGGTQAGAPAPPGQESFWVARSRGAGPATMNWKVRDGSYRLVIMRADGAPGLATRGTFAVEVPNIPTYGWIGLGAGLLIMVGGVVLIVGMVRRPTA